MAFMQWLPKKPTYETARELLSDIQLEKEIYLIEFTCPNFYSC